MNKNSEKGFITTLILVIIGLVLLQNVFHIDVIGFIESKIFAQFIAGAKAIILSLWKVISSVVSSS